MKQSETKISRQHQESIKTIRQHIRIVPDIGIILGSGLGDFANTLDHSISINTSDIPHYPHSSVVGHRGKLVSGKIGACKLLVFQGRVHFYETGNLETVLYPIRIARALGIKMLIVTNAAGGVNAGFSPGDLMMITDQINLTFENPLQNIKRAHCKKELYDTEFQKVILDVSKKKSIPVRQGIYCGVKGPSYETAAEIRMAKKMGADAIGMSTINEVSLAVALGIRVAGISCITNLSTGISGQKLSHNEVTEVANMVRQSFTELLKGVIEKIN